MECSKKMMLLQYAISIILILSTIYCAFTDHDASVLGMLAGASTLGDGAMTGFYFWKSKNENRAKYAQRFITRFADKYGVDAAIRIAEVVLKD